MTDRGTDRAWPNCAAHWVRRGGREGGRSEAEDGEGGDLGQDC